MSKKRNRHKQESEIVLGDAVVNRLAASIAEDIMVNGSQQVADRLVLMSDDNKDLGGWSRDALAARIAKILRDRILLK